VVRTRLVAGELRNLSILALLMVCFQVAEHQAPQSGILAAVVMGITMSAADLPDLVSVKAFKGQLTTLVISSLFILLAGKLDLTEVINLGWKGPAVVGAVILLVRPAAVLFSVWPNHMPLKDRSVLALTAPRGIVAAAVASLAAHRMADLQLPGASSLEGLVYLTILITGAWSTAMAVVLPRVLGYVNDPSRRPGGAGGGQQADRSAGASAAAGPADRGGGGRGAVAPGVIQGQGVPHRHRRRPRRRDL
jgi:NhaP-type Na+/H+ or K+/H+ antiporter